MLCIDYDDVRWIPCSCSECLSKLDSTCNIIQYKVNQVLYRGENQQCVYWPILGSLKNWQIIHYIDSRKQHEATNTEINVHINKNSIRDIDLNIGKYIGDKDYGEIPTMKKCRMWIFSC